MLIVSDLLHNVDIQVTVHYCYYDYKKSKRIEISEHKACAFEIRYMYVENGEIFIEVEREYC